MIGAPVWAGKGYKMPGEGSEMNYAVVIAGFGGQGVLLMGELLAYCGMKEGLEVTWMPSYGVEMRGGAAGCTVILSEERIGAPVVGRADALIAMSKLALHRHRESLLPRGLLLINSSLIPAAEGGASRDDIEELPVPAEELAGQSGDGRMANLAMLGAFLGHTLLIAPGRVAELVPSFLSPKKKKLAPSFARALEAGSAYVLSRKGR